MNSLFATPAVAADAAADAAIGNIRKQKELEMELVEIDKQWLCARKQIIYDRLDILKELDRIARVKVHRDYFKDHLRKANLHHYTTKARSRMRQQQYTRSHDNFSFTVDPLRRGVVPEPMIMEGSEKEGREIITSTSQDKKRAKHIRGLSELEVKIRRFRIPKTKKKKKAEVVLPPLPDKIKRLKKVRIVEFDEIPEEVNSSDEEDENRESQATSISITHHGHETDQESFERTSLFTIPGEKVPFARAFIPLPTLPLTPEPSFVEDESNLQLPQSPSQITARLLSPLPLSRPHRPKSPRPRSPNPPRSPRAKSPNPSRSRAKSPNPPRSPSAKSPENLTSAQNSVWKFPEVHHNANKNTQKNFESYEGVQFVLPPISTTSDEPTSILKKPKKKGGKKNKTKRQLDVESSHPNPTTAVELENQKSKPYEQTHPGTVDIVVSEPRTEQAPPPKPVKTESSLLLPEIDDSPLVAQNQELRPQVLTKKHKGFSNLSKSPNTTKRKNRKLSTVTEEYS
ncbi:hypothetical protein LOTGIDRAFT_162862 [Lottia gigantea]|uniref:Uncharacterized protein n=1 Tax=Lottia gigantea TaxID=225164 RepID=V4AFP6_LOTGI|nr:hypothetical protein LOTGIDRAFT_162862 [Lottia gigantea]ESO92206.1 hypothetical protein LOTGIDRAFT_162862 [Lottia gigantea]